MAYPVSAQFNGVPHALRAAALACMDRKGHTHSLCFPEHFRLGLYRKCRFISGQINGSHAPAQILSGCFYQLHVFFHRHMTHTAEDQISAYTILFPAFPQTIKSSFNDLPACKSLPHGQKRRKTNLHVYHILLCPIS